jgi:hypothetical protein
MSKMKRIILVLLILMLILSGCQANTAKPSQRTGVHGPVQVKGLVLKYVLIDTAFEIYQSQGIVDGSFTRSSYITAGDEIYKHYKWMASTYEALPDDMKQHLINIFDNTHAWPLMNTTTALSDDASVGDIVESIKKSNRSQSWVKSAEIFFPYFHENHFKDYLVENKENFQSKADRINTQLKSSNPDIMTFMEDKSGILFSKDYQPFFYYTLRYMGAMGFSHENKKVSTIQRNINDYNSLMLTPFHEFSHELFQTFTRSKDFVAVTELMKEVDAFKSMWHQGFDYSYDWIGWCEENLVEGFSKYLAYHYYGYENYYVIYMYDGDFYKYLLEINFDPEVKSLEEVSIEFYKDVIYGN